MKIWHWEGTCSAVMGRLVEVTDSKGDCSGNRDPKLSPMGFY